MKIPRPVGSAESNIDSLRPPSQNGAMLRRCSVMLLAVGWTLVLPGVQAEPKAVRTRTQVREVQTEYSFAVAGDMRSFVGPAPAGKSYFDGACEALRTIGPGSFMIVPGDCDPPGAVRAALDRYLGPNYPWYPVAGNHELNTSDLTWLRRWAQNGIPGLVRRGPAGGENTTYSFDFGNSHFVLLNQYYDGRTDAVRRRADLPDQTLKWLKKDLGATRKPLLWVIGHLPIQSLPDLTSGRVRHAGESVSTNTARKAEFVELLRQYHVRAYLCGHTHNCSIAKVQGVWQVDTGHARGAGDTGAPSTFLKVRVASSRAWVDIYRADPTGQEYSLRQTIALD